MTDLLKKRFSSPLPGKQAQLKMAPMVGRLDVHVPPTAIVSCVLILLYPKQNLNHFVLVQRTGNLNDRHSGQVSFPGGRYELEDGSLEQCALREAHEEIGVNPNDIEILGKLTDLYIPVSNFLVHPFVGFMQEAPNFNPQITEVHEVLEVPTTFLRQTDIIKSKDIRGGNGVVLKNVPYYDIYGKIVWGATAMMLSEFNEII